MKKILLPLFFFGLLAMTSWAQNRPCPEYNKIFNDLKDAYHDNDLPLALKKIKYLRSCDPNDNKVADEWTDKIFAKMRLQRADSDTARARAQKAEARANLALKRTNRLVGFFGFGKENAAWAYQNGRFAVIDRQGNRLTNYIYETPDSFELGFALTQVNGQYVFINDKGKEQTRRYDYIIEDIEGFHHAGLYPSTNYNRGGEEEWIRIDKKNLFAVSNRHSIAKLNIFQAIKKLNQNNYLVQTNDLQWSKLGIEEEKISETPFSLVKNPSEGLTAVKVNSLWGVIDVRACKNLRFYRCEE